jgi:hypothetical protein
VTEGLPTPPAQGDSPVAAGVSVGQQRGIDPRIESFSLLDRESRRRRDTDVQLSFAMYLILGFFTLGIYAIYIHYKLIDRQQNHFKRMGRFNEDLFKVISERAEVTGRGEEMRRELDELRVLNDDYQRLQRGKERSAGLWTFLSVITFGILFFYVLYFLNDDLRKHQAAEAEYIEKASHTLNKLGIGRHPVVVEQVVPDRSFALYLVLTIVTLGFFEIYWAYVRIKDGNDHFLEHDRFEDQLVGLIRAAA